jgi:hypothetical protein
VFRFPSCYRLRRRGSSRRSTSDIIFLIGFGIGF